MDSNLMLIHVFIILVNIIINLKFYLGSRKRKEYKLSLVFWVSFFFNFSMQGLFENHHQLLGLSMIFVGFAFYATLCLVADIMETEINHYFYLKVCSFLYLIGLGLSFTKVSFTTFTLPIMIACTLPFFHFSLINFNKIKALSFNNKSGLVLFSLAQIHMLDYPFLRLNKSFVNTGFLIATGMMILFSLITHY